VQRAVERADRQLGGPVELHLVDGEGSLARHRLPRRPVVLQGPML
jgi:hypothetical protein